MEYMPMKPQQNLNMNEPTHVSRLYVMVGAPGSGKSTYAREHLADSNTIYISRDEVRFSLLGPNDGYFSKEKQVWKEFMKRVKNAVNDNHDVIIDASHIDIWSRKKLTKSLDEELTHPWEIYYIVMGTPYEECLRRNDTRIGRANVPHSAIKEMYNKMTIPKKSEHPNIKDVWVVGE